ncbi:MAG: efflux RND transporter periplasmic adaptor subunit [Lysobacteraceae bacterium]
MPAPVASRSRTTRLVLAGLVVVAALAGLWAWRHRAADAAEGGYRTEPVRRGDIRVAISATGTLSAISTVDVGSQISGQVTEVLADFNDHVRKGQVLARIDPSTYQAQIAQGNAAANSARASLASAQAALKNAEADYRRKAALAGQQLVARSDVDLARAALDQARAQANAAQAQIGQQVASTETARLNLQRTVIRSPVDGVVLTRSIEPGQTVAASLQAPVLFQIAEDLSQMQILLAVDEADIGQVKPGQAVTFTVDAFPDRQYRGTVQQVRLSSTNTSNVITYPVVVSVRNDDQSLLPGMTANAEIEVSLRRGVLEVPNAALRFHPADEPDAAGDTGARAGGGMADALAPIAAGLHLTVPQQAAFDAALAQLRERMAARSAPAPAQGGASPLFGRGGGNAQRAGAAGAQAGNPAMRQRMQARFQQQFGAFRATLDPAQRAQWDSALTALLGARRAPLYLLTGGKPRRVMVRVGASDGSNTEVSGNLREGDQVIFGARRPDAAAAP